MALPSLPLRQRGGTPAVPGAFPLAPARHHLSQGTPAAPAQGNRNPAEPGEELRTGDETGPGSDEANGSDVRLHEQEGRRREERGPARLHPRTRHRLLQLPGRQDHQREIPLRRPQPHHRRMVERLRPGVAHQALRPLRHRQHQPHPSRCRTHPPTHHHRGREGPTDADELRIPLRAEHRKRSADQHCREPRGIRGMDSTGGGNRDMRRHRPPRKNHGEGAAQCLYRKGKGGAPIWQPQGHQRRICRLRGQRGETNHTGG